MTWLQKVLLIPAISFYLASTPMDASETEQEIIVPPELTDEDPTNGEVAHITVEIGVPVNRDYRRYHRGYYRCRYPFYYIDDPYYYYGPGYYHYYGRYYDDDDDDCGGRRSRRRHRGYDCDDD